MKGSNEKNILIITERIISYKMINFHAHPKLKRHDDVLLPDNFVCLLSLSGTILNSFVLCNWVKNNWKITYNYFPFWFYASAKYISFPSWNIWNIRTIFPQHDPKGISLFGKKHIIQLCVFGTLWSTLNFFQRNTWHSDSAASASWIKSLALVLATSSIFV